MRSGLTHREIAKLLGTSHTNVQNIEKRALAKMRRHAELRGIDLGELFEYLATCCR